MFTWNAVLAFVLFSCCCFQGADSKDCHRFSFESKCNEDPECFWSEDTCVSLDITITELMIEPNSRKEGSRFVEILNRGDTVTLPLNMWLEGIFFGALSKNESMTIANGQFLVIYDGDKTKPICEDCKCNLNFNLLCADAIYVKCCDSCHCHSVGTEMNNRNWNQQLTMNEKEIEGLSFNLLTFPQIDKGYGFKLLNATKADNQNGHNWAQTCNTQGTPGGEAFDPNNCTWLCTEGDCRKNGDKNAICVYDTDEGDYCECGSEQMEADYYYEHHTCKQVPAPDSCTANILRDSKGQRYIRFTWGNAAIERRVNYSLTYFAVGGNDKILTATTTEEVFDYDFSRDSNLAGVVRTKIGNLKSQATECLIPQSPTQFESTQPSQTPSESSGSSHKVALWIWVFFGVLLALLILVTVAVLSYKHWWTKRVSEGVLLQDSNDLIGFFHPPVIRVFEDDSDSEENSSDFAQTFLN